jgi:hypothetical protein
MGNRIGFWAMAVGIALPLAAQPPRGGRGGPPPTAKATAPIDLTGYWVSIVDEDWRFRMVTPTPGDYMGVPMNAASKQVADTWDPAKDEASGDQCKAYGAPALLRVPEHLRFSWQDDQTLKLETDAGTQTRLFHFGSGTAPGGPATLQGDSAAAWEITGGGGRGGFGGAPAAAPDPNAPPQGKGTLKVTTTHLKAGYLRRNGVPYSENAELTEYYDMIREHNGDVMLVVTIVTNDPKYLREPFIITSHFKKQAGDDGWKPTPCSVRW